MTILPEIAVKKELEQECFTSFQLENGTIETAILIILHKDEWIAQSMEAFIKEVKACFL